MKYLKSIHIISTCCALLAGNIFQACDKDESFDVVGSGNTFAYINTWNQSASAVQNEQVFNVTQTPIGIFGDISLDFPVRVNKLTKEFTAALAIDNSLVEAYNQKNGTQYLTLPESNMELTNSSLNIQEGATLSTDSVSFHIEKTKVAEFEPGDYLVPIRLTTVSNGVHISSNLNTVYLKIHVRRATQVAKEQVRAAEMLGTLIPSSQYNTWSYSSDQTSSPIANLWSTRTSSYLSFTSNPATLVFDMKSPKKISGLRVYARNATSDPLNTFAQVKFSLSMDGISYTEIADFSRDKMITENGYQYIGMYGPVEAQYIKLELDSPTSGLVFMGVYNVQ